MAQPQDPRRSLRHRILDFAYDESAVWTLTTAVTVYRRAGAPIEPWPSARADELRPELEALLREGKVELVPYGGGPSLTLEDALDEIERDDAWLPPLESGRNGCEVILTPAGDAEGAGSSRTRRRIARPFFREPTARRRARG